MLFKVLLFECLDELHNLSLCAFASVPAKEQFTPHMAVKLQHFCSPSFFVVVFCF